MITRSNTQELVGHAAIYDGTPAKAICCDLIMKMKVDSTKADTRYVHFYLRSRGAREYLTSRAQGASSTMKKIGKEVVQNIPIPLPPLAEQQRIVCVLDEAFEGIAAAKANAERNLQNARALFESHLQSVFSNRSPGWLETTIGEAIRFIDYRGKTPEKTESGLRLITAKNVKMGYLQKTPMEFVAPESYDAWMTRGIPRRGDVLFTTEAPLANVAQLDTDEKVVFAQRIIIMQPDATKFDGTFLKYLLLSQPVQKRIRTKGTGATVQGIKASLLKTIEISFPRSLAEQKQIVVKLDALTEETQRLATIYERKVAALAALKKSLLHQAFSGELTRDWPESKIIPFPVTIPGISMFDLHAGMMALAFRAHEAQGKSAEFGHVKAAKTAHMIEAVVGIDLGRQPVKDAAGPNDFPRFKEMESRAAKADYFLFGRVDRPAAATGSLHQITKRPKFENLLQQTEQALGEYRDQVEHLLSQMVKMNRTRAEVLATIFAAWNNLLLDGEEATEDRIVLEARERWHPDKLSIPREEFVQMIPWMRENGFVPVGRGKRVNERRRGA